MAASAQSYGTKGVYATNGSAVIVGQKAARDVYGGTVINPKFIGSEREYQLRSLGTVPLIIL